MAKYASGKYLVKNVNKYMGKRAPTYRSSWNTLSARSVTTTQQWYNGPVKL